VIVDGSCINGFPICAIAVKVKHNDRAIVANILILDFIIIPVSILSGF
jgi:hypothetical protein